MRQVNGAVSGVVWFLYKQQLVMAYHFLYHAPLSTRRAAKLLVLKPLLALGKLVTGGLLASIDLLGAISIAATKSTLLVSEGALLGCAMAAGLSIGMTSLVLSQRVYTDLPNVQLLWEDLCRLPGLLWKWLVYGIWSTAHSRLASGDARISYGAAL